MTRRVYIAGPMRGRPEFGFPAFDAAAAKLRARGWTVFSPAERDRAAGFDERGLTGHEPLHTLENFDHREAILDDLRWIVMKANAIYMLAGWQTSKGAVAERAVALALDLDVLYESDGDAAILAPDSIRRNLPA